MKHFNFFLTLLPFFVCGYAGATAHQEGLSLRPFSDTENSPILTGRVSQRLPQYSAKNHEYGFQIMFRNEGNGNALDLHFDNTFPKEATLSESGPFPCREHQELAPQEFCVVEGTLLVQQDLGLIELSSIVTSREGYTAEASTHTQAFGDFVELTAIQPIPNKTMVFERYPFSYRFDNRNEHLSATSLDITNLPSPNTSGITLIEDAESCLIQEEDELAPTQSCTLSGYFEPLSGGQELNLGAVFHYLEGEAITMKGHSNVFDADISGHILKAIPDKTVLNRNYPFVFVFTNTAATTILNGVHLEVAMEDTEIDPGSDCQQLTTLAPQASCTIFGTFTPTQAKEYLLAVHFYSEQTPDYHLSQLSEARKLTASGRAQIPPTTHIWQTYGFNFTFTNTDVTEDITQIKFDYEFPATLQAVLDPTSSCIALTDNSLPAQASCQIQGTFTPRDAGTYGLKATLSFLEGDALSLTTYTSVEVDALSLTTYTSVKEACPQGIVCCEERGIGELLIDNHKTYIVSSNSTIKGDIEKWLAGTDGIEGVCTSQVTDMYRLFHGSPQFNEDISDWDVSSVTDMRSMFYSAEVFNQDIGDWDVSHATNCEKFNYGGHLSSSYFPHFTHCTTSRFAQEPSWMQD